VPPTSHFLGRLLVVALTLMKSPMLMTSVLGAGFAWYAIPLPMSIGRVLDLLASSSGPVALFALGLSLIGHTLLGNLAEIFWISILKVIVQPLLTFLCVTYVFYMEPFWAQSAVILAALPIGSTALVIAHQYDVAVRRASATVALSSIISIATLSALLIYYEV
jgi:malonate transporter